MPQQRGQSISCSAWAQDKGIGLTLPLSTGGAGTKGRETRNSSNGSGKKTLFHGYNNMVREARQFMFDPMISRRTYYVYIVTNSTRTILHVDVTNNIYRTINELKHDGSAFLHPKNCNCLLYYEEYASRGRAIGRKKQLTYWELSWKMKLIMIMNPGLKDLAYELRICPRL